MVFFPADYRAVAKIAKNFCLTDCHRLLVRCGSHCLMRHQAVATSTVHTRQSCAPRTRDLLQPSRRLPHESAVPVSLLPHRRCTALPIRSMRGIATCLTTNALRRPARCTSPDDCPASHAQGLLPGRIACASVLATSARRRCCSAFLACVVGVHMAPTSARDANGCGHGAFPLRRNSAETRLVRTPNRKGLAAGNGIQEFRAGLYGQRTGFHLICGHDRALRHRGSTMLSLDDPYISDTRSEQGLPTPRCLCEGGSGIADLPFSTQQPCPQRHQHDPLYLAFLVSIDTSRSCRLSAVLAWPTACSLFQVRVCISIRYTHRSFLMRCAVLGDGARQASRGMLFRSPTIYRETGTHLVCTF
ncbi:hypothetical protein SVAN01_08433 [Stagonosporopsis vannaccii]|nr:hypothetical protein SVAN01_08433 [Stagonosporopsis vannaccii]